MGLVEWWRSVDRWRSNYCNMWKQRSERKDLLRYLDTADMDDVEELKKFFSRNRFDRFAMIPYMWALERYFSVPKAYFDMQKEMYYVDWNGKRLYWKRGTSEESIVQNVRILQIEQMERSPHRYEMPEDFSGGIVADLGTAEGCFALDVIDRVSHIYLFECDEEWIEPLTATFSPWREKVTIVKKFIGRQSGGAYTTLDEYFSARPLDFIKADIEGAEVDMLSSGEEVLRHKVRGANICLYHRATDEDDILALLRAYGYTCSLNPGYMFFYGSDGVGCSKNPKDWFRRGVVRAERVLS